MSPVAQLRTELTALCVALERVAPHIEAREDIKRCRQLWRLVHRACPDGEKEILVRALSGELMPLAERSRTLAQSLESALERRSAQQLLERPAPLSVAFYLSGGGSDEARQRAFESLLHGYPMAWAVPRYTAELELLRRLDGPPKTGRIVAIGPSAIPFTAVFFSCLRGFSVTYFDPHPESLELGLRFIARLEELAILPRGAVQARPISTSAALDPLPPCDAAFIIDQRTPHRHWLAELARLRAPLIFCRGAVALAGIIYQPLMSADVDASLELVGETIPAHASGFSRGAPVQVDIPSSAVFLTTSAYRLRTVA